MREQRVQGWGGARSELGLSPTCSSGAPRQVTPHAQARALGCPVLGEGQQTGRWEEMLGAPGSAWWEWGTGAGGKEAPGANSKLQGGMVGRWASPEVRWGPHHTCP